MSLAKHNESLCYHEILQKDCKMATGGWDGGEPGSLSHEQEQRGNKLLQDTKNLSPGGRFHFQDSH